MPTTSNFGWTTPADTDLVKDGALAIRTLGNGIDTSMAQLKGGTTGQVLSKTSNTDMAFTWVTQDDANAIQNTIVDAKGDLISASGNDVPARLAVGNNGETLVADSSTSTGLRYIPYGSPNFLINGGFDFWQRGTSFPNQSVYTADRWYNSGSANITGSQQSSNPPSGSRYFFRQTATSTGGYYNLDQYLETSTAAALWGRTVTFSVKLRRSSTFDATLFIGIEKTTTVDGGSGATWTSIGTTNITGSTIPSGSTVSDWATYSLTVAIPNDGTANGIRARLAYLSNPANGSYVEIAQFQLELGSTVTPFRRAGGTLAGELAACQRYYQKSFEIGTAPTNGNNPNGLVYFTRQASSGSIEPTAWVKLAPSMRNAPSVTLFNPYLASPTGQWSDGSTSSANARVVNIGDGGFIIDNTDVTYSVTNAGIHYTASSEL